MITEEEERLLATLPQRDAEKLRAFTMDCRAEIEKLKHAERMLDVVIAEFEQWERMAREGNTNDGTPWLKN